MRALVNEGYIVHILCHKQTGKPEIEYLQGLTIHRLIPSGNSVFLRFNNIIFYWTFLNLIWSNYIYKWIKANRIEVIHVHDLPLVNTALHVQKRIPSLKILADLHENYPAGLQVWRRKDSHLTARVWRLFHGYKRWLKYEKRAVQKVDVVLAVVMEMKQRLIHVHHLKSEKIFVVSNTEGIDFVREGKIDKELQDRYADHFTLLYIGGFGPHRGIDTTVCAMERLKEYPIELLLVGKGNRDYELHLKKMLNEKNLNKSVQLCGWQPFDRVYSYMRAASVGLVPHNSNEHTDNTIPHKLFQYMMARIPVIVSDCPPLKRTVEEIGAGLVFRADDPTDLSSKILLLFNDQKKCTQMGNIGYRETVEGMHNWEYESKSLLEAYRKLSAPA